MFQSIRISRAIAAVLVVCFHAAGTLALSKYFGHAADGLEKVFAFGGRAGVDFFFVLSGFIITYAHCDDIGRPGKLAAYLAKRAQRIYPTYWIVFAAVYIVATLIPAFRDTAPRDPWIVIKSLLLVPQDKAVIGGTGAPLIIVAWSLQYEIMFYLGFGVAILSRGALAFLLTSLLIGSIFRTIGATSPFPLSFLTSHYVLLFLLGVLASIFLRTTVGTNSGRTLATMAAIAFLAIGVTTDIARDPSMDSVFDIAFGISGALLVFGLVRYETALGKRPVLRIPALLGDSSYALYLIHFPLISLLCKLAILVFPRNHLGSFAAMILIVATCLIAGLCFHSFVEQPLLRRLAGRKSKTNATGAA